MTFYKNYTLKECYELGFDEGKNGPNDENCHFTIFSRPENTKAWEEGNKEGLKEKK